MSAVAVHVRRADLDDSRDTESVVELLDMYAREAVGQGRPLDDDVKRRLVPQLRLHHQAHVLLAESDQQAIGLAICFLGFSTFAARPLLNVHDFAVRPGWRGQGVGRRLLEGVEAVARRLDCVKITLEVRGDNAAAQRLYRSFGFESAGSTSQQMLFWSKPLDVAEKVRTPR